MDGDVDLAAALAALAATLPRDSGFEWEDGPDGLHLAMLSLPKADRGIGTGFVARVLAQADRREIPVSLEADSTGQHGDPKAVDLARWYRRFGFVLTGLTPEGWLCMHRTPRPYRGEGAILADYASVRRHGDLTDEAFAAAHASLIGEEAAEPPLGRALAP